MKKTIKIFHVIYLITTLAIIYFSIDILINTEDYMAKIKLSSFVKFPRYMVIGFLMTALSMSIEFIISRIRIRRLKNEIEDLEDNVEELNDEIKNLKVKMFDLMVEDEDGDEDEDEDGD